MRTCMAGLHRKVGPGRCPKCRAETLKRYDTSAKGRAKAKRYRLSGVGRSARERYARSEKGLATQQRYRMSAKGIAAKARGHAKAVETGRIYSYSSYLSTMNAGAYWRRMMEVSE